MGPDGERTLNHRLQIPRDIRLMDDVLHSLKHAPEWTMEGIFTRNIHFHLRNCSNLK